VIKNPNVKVSLTEQNCLFCAFSDSTWNMYKGTQKVKKLSALSTRSLMA